MKSCPSAIPFFQENIENHEKIARSHGAGRAENFKHFLGNLSPTLISNYSHWGVAKKHNRPVIRDTLIRMEDSGWACSDLEEGSFSGPLNT